MNPSNGYEALAQQFTAIRHDPNRPIGTSTVRSWVQSLTKGSHVLDLGCGSGIPISKAIADQGHRVYGIDASPTLVAAFRDHLPDHPIRCEAVETSGFYGLQFEGIIAWGLLFLLPEQTQVELFAKIADHLHPEGQFLFTAPSQIAHGPDLALTGRKKVWGNIGTVRTGNGRDFPG